VTQKASHDDSHSLRLSACSGLGIFSETIFSGTDVNTSHGGTYGGIRTLTPWTYPPDISPAHSPPGQFPVSFYRDLSPSTTTIRQCTIYNDLRVQIDQL